MDPLAATFPLFALLLLACVAAGGLWAWATGRAASRGTLAPEHLDAQAAVLRPIHAARHGLLAAGLALWAGAAALAAWGPGPLSVVAALLGTLVLGLLALGGLPYAAMLRAAPAERPGRQAGWVLSIGPARIPMPILPLRTAVLAALAALLAGALLVAALHATPLPTAARWAPAFLAGPAASTLLYCGLRRR